MSWVEGKPEPTDIPNGEFCSLLTGNAATLRQGLEQHYYWSVGSGVSAGVPLLSDGSFGPGVARAFYDVQSSLSSAPTGKLYLTSDMSRLFLTQSAGTTLMGAQNAIVAGGPSVATITQNSFWVVESGSTASLAGGVTVYRQDFPVAYVVAPPVIQLQTLYSTCTGGYLASVVSRNASGFSFQVGRYGTESLNSCTVFWRSEGTQLLAQSRLTYS